MDISSGTSGNLRLHWFADCSEIDAESWLAIILDGLAAGISSDSPYPKPIISSISAKSTRPSAVAVYLSNQLHRTPAPAKLTAIRFSFTAVCVTSLCRMLFCLVCPTGQGRKRGLCVFLRTFLQNRFKRPDYNRAGMKGTSPILHDGQDERRAVELQNDPKNRAENVMIVDLLRNDLGKIAQTGKVRVPEPFKVSRFGSVWQMTSATSKRRRCLMFRLPIFSAQPSVRQYYGAPKRT